MLKLKQGVLMRNRFDLMKYNQTIKNIMLLTVDQLSFRRSFYSKVKERCAFVSFTDPFGDLSGNRIDYNRIDDSPFAGTVNCYFRSTEIEKYGGNICVGIGRKYLNDSLLKALYDKRHTKLTSRQFVISTNTKSLSAAVSWACKILQTIAANK